jgi:diguanylate cyclase (GGDEF)-like protein
VPDEALRGQLLVQRAIALRLLLRPAEGLPALREAIRVFGASESILEEGEAREELARAAAVLGDWRLAYDEQTRAREITQALLRRQVDNRFATMKAQFDAEKKEREFVMLQRENQAAERALTEQRRAGRLQVMATALASALALLLAALAWRTHRSGRRLHALAMTDELTGLPNRRDALGALERAIGAGRGGALAILDIDHFKRINDRHGHPAGDAVLREVTKAWRGLVGPEVTLGRLGGEEFVAMLGAGGLAEGRALGERLREAVAALDLSSWGGPQALTTSVGVTAIRPGDAVADVLARADAALYGAKQAGRDRVEVAA